MYNRYIPQSDGTFQRSRIPESPPRQAITVQSPQEIPCPPASAELPPCTSQNSSHFHPEVRTAPRRYCRPQTQKRNSDNSVLGFLKQLLPGNFDTADLFVVLLLLLMSGDCAEDQNTALLTLVLYLFL